MTVYLLAHGSRDPRHAADVSAIAARLAARASRDVRACYLDLCGPSLADAADRDGVVVPLLFSPGYHVQVDVGQAVATARADLTVATPPLLTSGADWGRGLLAEVRGHWPGHHVVCATAGSRDAGVQRMWEETSAVLGVPVVHASGPGPRLSGLQAGGATVVLPLLVARGHFGDLIQQQALAAGMSVARPAGSSQALISALELALAS